MRSSLLICLMIVLGGAGVAGAQTEPGLAPTPTPATPTPVPREARHSLTVPILTWAAATAADQVTTYQFSSRYRSVLHESNPLVRPFDRHPALLVAAGSALDVGAAWLTNHWLGRRHPRLAKIAFFGAAGYRAYLAGYNVGAMRHARAVQDLVRAATTPSP